jgi:hypothetical protein
MIGFLDVAEHSTFFNDLLVTGLCLRPEVKIIHSRIQSTELFPVTGHQKQHTPGYINQTNISHPQELRENYACMRSWYVGNSIYLDLNSLYLSGLYLYLSLSNLRF